MVLAKIENVKADLNGRLVLTDTEVKCDEDIARWCACCGSVFMSRIGTCELIGALHQRPGGRTCGLQFGGAHRVPNLDIQGENSRSDLLWLCLSVMVSLLKALAGKFGFSPR